MTDSRTFTFRSGYPIRLKESYDPRLFDAAVQGWSQDNPMPTPPTIEERVPWGNKEGFKIIKRVDRQDSSYQRAVMLYQADRANMEAELLNRLALDRTSIDMEVVTIMRGVAEQNDTELSKDDLVVYLQSVYDATPDKDGNNELNEFYQWVRDYSRPTGALIQQYIDRFRGESNAPRRDDADMGSQTPGVVTAESRAAATTHIHTNGVMG